MDHVRRVLLLQAAPSRSANAFSKRLLSEPHCVVAFESTNLYVLACHDGIEANPRRAAGVLSGGVESQAMQVPVLSSNAEFTAEEGFER